MLKGTMKLNSLVLSLSMITSGCALADWSKNMTFSVPTQIDMAKLSPQEREEIEREQARLMAEKQALLEMSLTHEIGEQNLQFKSLLAKFMPIINTTCFGTIKQRKNNFSANMPQWLQVAFLKVPHNLWRI